MRLLLGAALLAVGILLLAWGIDASRSAGSEISRWLTGTPTHRSMELILGGMAAALVGLFMVVSSKRNKVD